MAILSNSDFLSNKTLPVKLIRRDPQEAYGLHSHEFSELVIVYRGSGDHLIHGERRPISAGDVFLIRGQTRHGYENLHGLALCNLLFDLHETANPLFALSRYPLLRRLTALEPGRIAERRFHLMPEEMPRIMEVLNAIEEEQNGRNEDYPSAMAALFVLLIVRLSRFFHDAEPEQDGGPHTRRATVAGLSVSTFPRPSGRATGYAPNEYLQRLRLKKSTMLLLNPELSISEIAERTGFSDSNYFCRQFRARYNVSPQKYRKLRNG